jgi:nitroimidazol reductase NimA-like FMN-containing flavoprotein (pyridoxamine 5'-phosphate oxidase superfamily)
MRIFSISEQECGELLKRVSIGRLACSLDGQPYAVPIAYSYEPDSLYCFSTLGQKIEWMRQNPKVCLQVDEIGNHSNWSSAIVTGTYLELPAAQYAARREHARELAFHTSKHAEKHFANLLRRRTVGSRVSVLWVGLFTSPVAFICPPTALRRRSFITLLFTRSATVCNKARS